MPGKDKDSKNQETMGILRTLALLAQIGLSIVIPLVVMVWLGQLVGNWLGAETLFLIISILLGLGGGFLAVYRILFREIK